MSDFGTGTREHYQIIIIIYDIHEKERKINNTQILIIYIYIHMCIYIYTLQYKNINYINFLL